MKPIERDLMSGMVNILNEAIESNRRGTPIMDDEYFNTRLADLKQFEDETGVMYVGSPNCNVDIKSIVNIEKISRDNLKECKDVSEIVEYSNQNEMIVYVDAVGSDMVITYENGFLTNIKTNDIDIENKIKLLDLPYTVKKDGVYIIKGKIAFVNKPIFYVYDILEGGNGNIIDDFAEAKELNFDIVPFWFVNNLNQKKIKDSIEYVFDYITDDDLRCNGVVFKFTEKNLNNVLNYVGCYYKQ